MPSIPLPSAGKALINLDTERLHGVPICMDHYAHYRTIHGDARCAEPMALVPMDHDYTLHYLNSGEAHWSAYGFGIRTFFLKEDNRFVGFGGLRRHEDRTDWSIAYAVTYDLWGTGLATEMSRAFIEQGFSQLGMQSASAITFASNLPSQRVMEKIGLTRGETFYQSNVRHIRYRCDRDTWRPS